MRRVAISHQATGPNSKQDFRELCVGAKDRYREICYHKTLANVIATDAAPRVKNAAES